MVFTYCRRFLRNRLDAEEVCQDIFLRVFHHLSRFEGRSSFKTWLITIARNECFRRQARIARISGSEVQIERGELESIPDSSEIREESIVDLDVILAMFSPEEKELLLLRYVADLSWEEITSSTGLNISAAKMRLHRAIERVKKAGVNFQECDVGEIDRV